MTIFPPAYDAAGTIVKNAPNIHTYGYTNPGNCNNFGFGVLIPRPAPLVGYSTEHILELQLLGLFLKDRQEKDDTEYSNPTGPDKIDFCRYFQYYWYKRTSLINNKTPVQAVFEQYPSTTANTVEFVLLVDGVNKAKKGMWGDAEIDADDTMDKYLRATPERAIQNVKDVLTAYHYHQIQEVETNLVAQANRVRDMFTTMETAIQAKYPSYQQLGLGSLWATWIRGRADRARGKAETYMNKWVEGLQSGYGTPVHRQKPDPAGVIFLNKIDDLAREVRNVISGGWVNPL